MTGDRTAKAGRRSTAQKFRSSRMLGAVLLPFLLTLTSCSALVPAPAQSSAGDESPDATALAPLRGTPVPAGSALSPSLAVKIDNHEAARPQVGLERTDIVFEELVEGGLTRYVAVWQSGIPELVGPVRSIRPMDPDIIAPFGGIVAYSGGQQQFVDLMEATDVVTVSQESDETGVFYREDSRDAPHNVILKAKELVDRNDTVAVPAQQFSYTPTVAGSSAATDGEAVSAVDSRFSDQRWPGWTWDQASLTYLRSQEGTPDLDGSGAQLRATNVLILRVDIDETSTNVPKTTMVGSGEAWVSAGGKSLHATWSKTGRDAPIRLVDDNGQAVRLAAGNTWIELVPGDRGSVELRQ
ncbi:DUF3048 domain-containing protein [Cryobacterium sp. TMT4-10]|nr:DUF3048 domain-containing protein [Cryobacterium sp. TMT4-10]